MVRLMYNWILIIFSWFSRISSPCSLRSALFSSRIFWKSWSIEREYSIISSLSNYYISWQTINSYYVSPPGIGHHDGSRLTPPQILWRGVLALIVSTPPFESRSARYTHSFRLPDEPSTGRFCSAIKNLVFCVPTRNRTWICSLGESRSIRLNYGDSIVIITTPDYLARKKPALVEDAGFSTN